MRRAYLGAARRLHPDLHAAAPRGEAERAARRMQEVNEAWRVLRDPDRRRAYDERLQGGRRVVVVRPGWSPAVDPDVDLDPRPYHHPDADFGGVGLRLVRGLPWALLAAVMAVLFVFTAYAGGGDDEGPSVDRLDQLVGDCVRVQAGLGITPVGCDEPNDGRAVLLVERPSQCPTGTAAYSVPGEAATVCLRRA